MAVEFNRYLLPCAVSEFCAALPSSLRALDPSDSTAPVNAKDLLRFSPSSSTSPSSSSSTSSSPSSSSSTSSLSPSSLSQSSSSSSSSNATNLRSTLRDDVIFNGKTSARSDEGFEDSAGRCSSCVAGDWTVRVTSENGALAPHQNSAKNIDYSDDKGSFSINGGAEKQNDAPKQNSTRNSRKCGNNPSDQNSTIGSSFSNGSVTSSADASRRGTPRKPCMRQLSLPARLAGELSVDQAGGDEKPRRRRSSVRFADEMGATLSTIFIIPSRVEDSALMMTSSDEAATRRTPHLRVRLCFKQPSDDYDNFLRKLQVNGVCLESVKVLDTRVEGSPPATSNEGTIQAPAYGQAFLCRVKVRNIAPEKSVHARCTANDWKTFVDVVAKYCEPTAGVQTTTEYDTFSFVVTKPQSENRASIDDVIKSQPAESDDVDTSRGINVVVGDVTKSRINDDDVAGIKDKNSRDATSPSCMTSSADGSSETGCGVITESDFAVEFAIRYIVRDLVYWDNNDGENYRIVWLGNGEH